jgi:hypothetical protein
MRVEPFLADTFSRRSRSFWRRVSRRCVWANSTEIVLTPICGVQIPSWSSTLTGTDPLLLIRIDPASAHGFVVSWGDQPPIIAKVFNIAVRENGNFLGCRPSCQHRRTRCRGAAPHAYR